jgi:hypothetical protein
MQFMDSFYFHSGILIISVLISFQAGYQWCEYKRVRERVAFITNHLLKRDASQAWQDALKT